MSFRHCSNKYKHNTITTPPHVILWFRPPLGCLICHTPIKNRGLSVDPWPFPSNLTMKNIKKRRSHVPFMLLDIILAQRQHPVASSKALDLLHQAMCTVTYRRIAMTIKTASFVGVFVDCCLFACCPGSCWANTEQVVAQCRHPVASRVALDMLHWAMRFVPHRRTAMAIERAKDRGTCWCQRWFCHQQ